MSKPDSLDIPAWGSEEALRKEAHVARFLAREYKSLVEKPVSLAELGVSASTGAMWEETEELIETHYDERIEFFDSFLDSHYRAYSMAYYGEDKEEVMNSTLSLEEAQENKFRLICDRIGIQGGEKILNIGCGFGSFELYILQHYPGIHVTGITPSTVQTDYLRMCLENKNCVLNPDNFQNVQGDFSQLSHAELQPESFDLIVSIGLLEQVKNMELLNKEIAKLLTPLGKAFHHFIVSRITIPQFLAPNDTLIGSYFPGGRIWPFEEFESFNKHLNLLDSWFINGMNYWRTLDEWHSRFSQNRQENLRHLGEDRLRYWNDYFILCKACFLPEKGTFFGNGHYLFQKPE
jgi:cyclopropane-fatty-acyl-phospholipid synthase